MLSAVGWVRGLLSTIVVVVSSLVGNTTPPPGTAPIDRQNGDVYARVADEKAILGNGLVERRWELKSFRTTHLIDQRGDEWVLGRRHRDFALGFSMFELNSDAFSVSDVRVENLPRGGLRLMMTMSPPLLPTLTVVRSVDAYPGVAGLRTETTLTSILPLALSRFVADEIYIQDAAATLHSLRSGADWREPGWAGPPVVVGEPHAGTWRDTKSAGLGEPVEGPGQWLSLADRGRSVFLVMERNDMPSSVMSYEGRTASAIVDHSRDVISLGPLEGEVHAENPLAFGETRARTVRPGEPLTLAPVFTGFGDHDGDEPWQFHKYLTEHRMALYPHAVTFNSNGTDSNLISTGAKDDMDFETVQEVADVARRMGVETFILDDGWQARSGDWQPDSPQYPEPRWDGSPTSKFKPRFPDSTFTAVREAIAPMRLGLWMSPTFFNPSSATFEAHPEWTCQPIGTPLIAANLADPGGGSNEAGLGPWSQAALAHVEARVRHAIESWDVVYFKFDFLAWLDCLTPDGGFRDLYEFHDAFVAMLDRIQADHPTVTMQIDETNDYRMFPYESVARGPSWFQNGHPEQRRMLHNLWNLSPYVPTFSLGQNALADEEFDTNPVDALMPGSLLSHITFFSDIREYSVEVVDRVATWTAFYKTNRSMLDGVVYPLLDDPMAGGWTALQTWDPEAGEGALLVFRQSSNEASKTIALKNVPDGTYGLSAAPTGDWLGTANAEELRAGLNVSIPEAEGASVVLIRRILYP